MILNLETEFLNFDSVFAVPRTDDEQQILMTGEVPLGNFKVFYNQAKRRLLFSSFDNSQNAHAFYQLDSDLIGFYDTPWAFYTLHHHQEYGLLLTKFNFDHYDGLSYIQVYAREHLIEGKTFYSFYNRYDQRYTIFRQSELCLIPCRTIPMEDPNVERLENQLRSLDNL